MTNKPRMFEIDCVSESIAASVPPRIKEGIDLFVCYGIAPRGFLYAVLTNNLVNAICRADDESLTAIKPICQYVYNEIPRVCHGSPDAVAGHIRKAREFYEALDVASKDSKAAEAGGV